MNTIGELVFAEESYAVRGAIFEVYKTLGSGYLEEVYQNALLEELSISRIPFEAKYKRTDMYNVRLGTRAGSVASTATLTRSPRFLVLYDVSDATKHSVYRIKSSGKCDKAKMLKLGYTTAQHDYYCYVLEEEVSLGDLDLTRLLADRRREQGASFKLGAPIYLKGGELISYRS